MKQKVSDEDFEKAVENAGQNINRQMRRHIKHRKESIKAEMAKGKNQNFSKIKNNGGIGSITISTSNG